MAKLLIQLIADFIRDLPTAPDQFGEALRCAILEDEEVGLRNYGMSDNQILILKTRDRQTFLNEISREIGAVMDEIDQGPDFSPAYPAGVHLREAKVIISNGNDRTVLVRGAGFAPKTAVTITPGAGGAAIPNTVEGQRCDADVWQRCYVKVTLAPGTYTVTVTNGAANASIELLVL